MASSRFLLLIADVVIVCEFDCGCCSDEFAEEDELYMAVATKRLANVEMSL